MQNKQRCKWCNLKNEKYIKYHDEEWGILNLNEQYLFEMLILESFQAGLSWECVLNKREDFREAFENFNIEKICTYDRKHHTDMMDTFIALVTNGWNLKVTSEKLFIHYNSMKYRYRKLGMILELDLQDQEERLNLELALKLYQMHEK